MSKDVPNVTEVRLASDTISQDDLQMTCKWMLSGARLTKGNETVKFESGFADWMGSKHAIFVNSGSSANLLMIAAAKTAGRLRNMKAIAPAVSWVTTVSPLIQLGFDVRLCDCDQENLGLDIAHLEKLCREDPPAVIIIVHVLAHANDMNAIQAICERYDIVLLEDSCEALGSGLDGRKLGSIGLAGSFSFYYGHHISTIEGGMVVTDDYALYQTMLSLRSHGWSRDLDEETRAQLQHEHGIDDFRNLYTFYHAGYNLRPTDVQAFIGQLQLKKLDEICKRREENFRLYRRFLPDFFCQSSATSILSSFAFGTLAENRLDLANALAANGIECRPLICGNIARHPFWIKRFGSQDLPNADGIHDFGIYLPNHHGLVEADIGRVCDVVNQFGRPI